MDEFDGAQTQLGWARRVALVISLAWAAWWTYFGLASTFGAGLPLGQALSQIAVPGLLFLAMALLAWRWEAIGGGLLVLVGSLILTAYPIMMMGSLPFDTILWFVMTIALPPLVAGWLFLLHWWRNREA